MPGRAAVLDFDGVIAKSMEVHAEAYRRVLTPFGVTVTDHDVFLREGARSESIIRNFLEGAGRHVDASEVARLADEKQAAFRFLGPVDLYDGAREMVRRLSDGVDALGLVTGTRRENLLRLIPDLVDLFDALLAEDAYTHDKPHPEPYEKAAAALERDPAACVALENAVRGVQSAHAAGYGRVVAITTTMSHDELAAAGADVIVPDHTAAADALLAWCRGD